MGPFYSELAAAARGFLHNLSVNVDTILTNSWGFRKVGL
jgi:hypothetical protein